MESTVGARERVR
ncbi:unnamed protein product, partial [Rotaria magnacalcarata]